MTPHGLPAPVAVPIGAPEYPPQLAALRGAPAVLWIVGDVAVLSRPAVSIVGTREASAAGLDAARRIARQVALRGLAVVSGLALGVDGAAHRACLDAGGVTVAVLAHGLDRVYPREHAQLAADIVARGGALVSEHPPGVAPERRLFVLRNRVQSGLSCVSVMVESGVGGGAMHHARFAAAQGRPVVVVESAARAFDGSGAAELVRTIGAEPARTIGGVLDAVARAVEAAETTRPAAPLRLP